MRSVNCLLPRPEVFLFDACSFHSGREQSVLACPLSSLVLSCLWQQGGTQGDGRRDARSAGCSVALQVLLQGYCILEVFNNRGTGEQAVPSPSYYHLMSFLIPLETSFFCTPAFQKTSVFLSLLTTH